MTMQTLLQKIKQLKAAIEELRPLDKHTLGKIEQKFRLDWNYHSNAIEGNSLNFGETKSFLLHGITAAGKPLKDHLDLRGHNEAILALEDIIKEERPITENFIRELHKVILVEDSYNPAQTPEGKPTQKKIKVGQYKSTNNHVQTSTGEIFYFASVEETPAKMHDLIEWLRKHKEQENPVVLAALFHYKFIVIHPFDDGNGRLARILMNFILMRAGFPPVVIKTKEKEAYFRALRQADGGNTGTFVEYIAEQLLASLELYLKGARGESIEELEDVDKEFELFKMELEGKEAVVYLTKKNRADVIQKEIIPFLETIFDKASKIDTLFQERVNTIHSSGSRKYSNQYSTTELVVSEAVYFGSMKEVESKILQTKFYNYKEYEDEEEIVNYGDDHIILTPNSYVINVTWKSLVVKQDIRLDYGIDLYLEMNIHKEFYWKLNYDSYHNKKINKLIEDLEIPYGNYDAQSAQELGNKILQDFMEFIRERIE